MYDEEEHLPMTNPIISSGNWIEYILETPLPNVEDADEKKKRLIGMLKPIMSVANKSNLERRDIIDCLEGYRVCWMKFFTYYCEGKRDPDLLVIRSSLREAYNLELRRSLGMGQMSMIFQPQKIQHVFQRFADDTKKKLRFFKTKDTPSQPGAGE